MPGKRKVQITFSNFYPLYLGEGIGVAVWYGGVLEVDEDEYRAGNYKVPPPSQSMLDSVREQYRHTRPPQWKIDHYERIKSLPR